MSDELITIAVRLTSSVVIGGVIGLHRDLHRKPAGVRTHALVSLGTALMVIVVMPPGEDLTLRYDALSRVIQGVLTGIGFLGAGVILHNPDMRQVRGLTTAATIWLTALLGVACGAGAYAPVLVAITLAAIVMLFGGRFERALRARYPNSHAPHTDEGADPPP